MSLDKTFIPLFHLFAAVPNLQEVNNAEVIDSFSINRPYLISIDSQLILISVETAFAMVDNSIFINALLDKEQGVIHYTQGSQELTIFSQYLTDNEVIFNVQRN